MRKERWFWILVVLLIIVLMNTEVREPVSIDYSTPKVDNKVDFPVEVVQKEVQAIPTPKFTECCTYTDSSGNEKACFAFQGNDCSYCNEIC